MKYIHKIDEDGRYIPKYNMLGSITLSENYIPFAEQKVLVVRIFTPLHRFSYAAIPGFIEAWRSEKTEGANVRDISRVIPVPEEQKKGIVKLLRKMGITEHVNFWETKK